MALLGAKRPQHKAWSFIVAAFWIVLALPALRVLVIPGGRFQLDGFRMLLTGVLCGISVINYLFSSRVGAVILLVTQVFFLYGQFPELVEGPWQCNLVLFVMDVLLLIGCVVAHRIVPRSPVAAETGMAGLEVAWRDFYRLFGVIWSLRVADQINATARRNSWDMVLHGSGFDVADPVAVDELTQVCANLLRRFVSTQWLAARVQITDDGSS